MKIKVNMTEFRKKFVITSDNYDIAEKLELSKGKMTIMDKERYINWLNEFNINYTITGAY